MKGFRTRKAYSGEMVTATGFYLENRTANHNKFYKVVITDDGVVSCQWGRIGTTGQSKLQRFQTQDDANAQGMERFFSKRTGGYTVVHEGVKFQIPREDLDEAISYSSAQPVAHSFWQAVNDPQFANEKVAVITHYDELVKKAQRLMDQAPSMNFEEAQAQFQDLEESWSEIQDKHDTVAVTIEFTRQILGNTLLSGKQ